MHQAPLSSRRLTALAFGTFLGFTCLVPLAPRAQVPAPQGPFFVSGRNVNTVGPVMPGPSNPDMVGDPLFKQQNEVDCDVSPNDPRLIFCATIDYRGIQAFGDSWIGVTVSDDGALTWRSRLHPDFPRAPGQVGAADPVVATVPGLALVGYITISRQDGRGSLVLGRWIEHNRENGDRYTFADRVVIGSGTPGRFADKPAMAVVLNQAGGSTLVDGRKVPSGVIHFGYAIFPGTTNNSSSEIYHLLSTDYGATWSKPVKLSESVGINQGVDFAVAGSTVVAAWRRVADNNEPDAIMFARSADGGATWSKARVLQPGTFFDQDSSDLQFRTRSMPALVHDGAAFHAFWAARGVAAHPEDARIVVSSSLDGSVWTPPVAVDNHAERGHQLMPIAAVAGGRLQVNWIDSRNNLEGSFGRTLSDYVYDDSESSTGKSVYRQSVDVFAAQAEGAASGQTALAFGASQQVSRYRTGMFGGVRRQLEYNFINARMFKQGAWPFHGDYHAVAAQRYRPSPTQPGGWILNTARSTSHALFYSAFTDNRDVEGYVWAGPASTPFTPAGTTTLQGESGDEVPAACDSGAIDPVAWLPGNSPRSRDQNVYAAATLPGLVVLSPSGSKPTGTLQRAYVVSVHNLTPEPASRAYRLKIANQPPGSPGIASWQRCEPAVPCSPLTELAAEVPRRSSITRTVYVTSSEPRPRILIEVIEVGGAGQLGSLILNADPDAPEIEQPHPDLASILSEEIYEPDILGRQTTLYYAGLTNPDIVPVAGPAAPRIEYPRIEYPRIEYPRIEYPRIEYTSIQYPRIEYPRIEYTSIENPRIEYSALTSDVLAGGTTEITWPVTTDGANTTTAMTAKVFVNGGLPAGTLAQVLVTVPYPNTVANSCIPGDTSSVVDNQVIVDAIVDPARLTATLDPPDVVNPPAWQPTFPVNPGQTVWVTLRIWGRADATLARRTGLWVRSQPDPAADGGLVDEDMDGVVDVTAPTIDLGGLDVGLDVEGNAPGGAIVTYTVTATDAVDGQVPVTCGAHPSGSFFPLGTTTVTCSATDASGNGASAAFDVRVADTVPPAFGTAPETVLGTAEATSATGTVVAYPLPVATDVVDSTVTVACARPPGSTFPIGTTRFTCTAADDSGNSASATFAVTITDSVAPVMTGVPAPLVAEATGPTGAVVTYPLPSATDLGLTVAVSCSPPPGSSFAIGTTTVVCTAADASGNTTTASFTVTVRDTAPPISISATVNPSLLWPPNGAIVQVTVSGEAFDAATGVRRLEWNVVDEYGSYQPSGSAAVAGNGPFSFRVPLLADRRGNDKDGRHYTIRIAAVDAAGNRLVLAQPLVVNVHDQGGM